MHDSILKYKKGRYFHISIVVLVACFIIYFSQGDRQPPNGGTWQGYVLGTLGAVLIFWLTALGKRKRNYRSKLGSLQGWVSAHVYLGSSLLIIATLHCAMQFGWNVHTLAYALMVLVIVSGFFGIYVYMRYPRLMAVNRSNHAREELFAELGVINESIRKISKVCDSEVQLVVDSAVDRTSVGGGVIAQLFASDGSQLLIGDQSSTASRAVNNKDQVRVVDFVSQRIPKAIKKNEAANLQELLSLLCRRQNLLRKIRKDIRLQSLLKIWLYFHVPLTIALLFALVTHILAVFFYW